MGRTKSLLRDAYKGLLPAEVTEAPKRGFEVPMRQWLESDLQELVHDLLGSPSALVGDYLTPSCLQGILEEGGHGSELGGHGVLASDARTVVAGELALRRKNR